MKRTTILMTVFAVAFIVCVLSIQVKANKQEVCPKCGGKVQVLARDVELSLTCHNMGGCGWKVDLPPQPLRFRLIDTAQYYIEQAFCN